MPYKDPKKKKEYNAKWFKNHRKRANFLHNRWMKDHPERAKEILKKSSLKYKKKNN